MFANFACQQGVFCFRLLEATFTGRGNLNWQTPARLDRAIRPSFPPSCQCAYALWGRVWVWLWPLEYSANALYYHFICHLVTWPSFFTGQPQQRVGSLRTVLVWALIVVPAGSRTYTTESRRILTDRTFTVIRVCHWTRCRTRDSLLTGTVARQKRACLLIAQQQTILDGACV